MYCGRGEEEGGASDLTLCRIKLRISDIKRRSSNTSEYSGSERFTALIV